jgi:hypothetical protein
MGHPESIYLPEQSSINHVPHKVELSRQFKGAGALKARLSATWR